MASIDQRIARLRYAISDAEAKLRMYQDSAYDHPGVGKTARANLRRSIATKKRQLAKLMRQNPAGIRGWVRAKAVKIVRDKKGRAVSVKIKT